MAHATAKVVDTAVRHTHVCAAASVDRVRFVLAARSNLCAKALQVLTRERVERHALGAVAAEQNKRLRVAVRAFSRGDSLGRCSQREKELKPW
ncbi:MAG: hypothetical protein JNN27_03480 [Planctomycetes bacterium]|nr:hypothetical protein [Planctomycetota bacterium]